MDPGEPDTSTNPSAPNGLVVVLSPRKQKEERLELGALNNPFITGVVLMSLVFGLAHAPGFIFRQAGSVEGLGSNPSALDAIAYSIVVLAISGITFGIVWARTKNLFAVMLIHAAGDLLPNFAGFVRTWL